MSAGRRAFVAFAALLAVATAPAQEKEPDRSGGPYVPTPQVVVDAMLRMANVGPQDYVIDLGSGDGVIVLTAASQLKASGHGVDIDRELVKHSNEAAKKLGIADRASFRVEDVFKADLSRASVITLYLLPSMMINIRGKIYLEAKPGTRIVSHDYTFDDWHPDDQLTLDVPEKEKINGVPRANILLWIVPAKVQGKWQVQVDGGERYDVSLRQRYQNVSGSVEAAGKPVRLTTSTLRGDEIRFTLFDGAQRRSFKGTATGESMQGTVDLGGGRTAKWTARRL
ncbi:MAG TPA: methyltransferase domain-containing protein [Burkholderiales bacterium]|nr:methyltransferase domain-containing protein [Burkholderiales bacterium]